MKSIQELREVRAEKSKALKAHVEKKEWKKEVDQPLYDTMMKEYDDVDSQIKAVEASLERTKQQMNDERIIDISEKKVKEAKSVEQRLYAKWLRNEFKDFDQQDFADYTKIRNTMSVGTPGQGGYTVQTEVAKSVLDALAIYGGMRKVSTILQTAMGNPMNFPASDGRAETGEIVAENAAAASLDIAFTNIPLNVYKFSSKVVTVPFELLQDAQVDIEAFVRGRLVTRLGRIQNTKFTLGTGTAEPTGIVTAATSGFVAANATSQVTAVTYASLVELVHSIDPAYRMNDCVFMMHDQSVKKIRQILDAQNRPIFVPGYTVGINGAPFSQPDTLLGYGIVVNQDVAQMGVSAKSILFGDFDYYYIRDVMAIEMFRFADSPYIKNGQIGFLAWMRSGGNLIDVGGAVKYFVNAAS